MLASGNCLAKIFVFSALCALTHSLTIGQWRPYQDVGLYNESDKVVELYDHDFKCRIYGSPKVWLVEFYNTWCGFCQRFAPIYKSVAQNISAWDNIITVAAIDCAVDDNYPICKEYEVAKTPTLKLFSVNSRTDDLGLKLPHDYNEDYIRNMIEDQLVKEYKAGRDNQWPNLAVYEGSDVNDLWKDAPSNSYFQFLIVEEPSSHLGLEVILDLQRIRNVTIRRAHSENKALLGSAEVTSFPAVIALSLNGSQDFVDISQPTREGVKESIFNFLTSLDQDNTIAKETPEVGNENTVPCKKPKNELADGVNFSDGNRDNFLVDFENALRYSLKREVAFSDNITDEKFTALKNYLAVLSAYVPRELRESLMFVDKLKSKLQNRAGVKGTDYMKMVEEAESSLPSGYLKLQEYVVCKGSEPRFGGYPCGLWVMFHTLTVAAAQESEAKKLDDQLTVLKGMHGYIKNFFGCKDCSEHFVAMSERRKLMDVSGVEPSVLWLWAAHNEVNQRLSGDPSEDPTRKKVQYPTVGDCPKCRGDNGMWVESEVLEFLKNHYDAKTVISQVVATTLQSVEQTTMEMEQQTSTEIIPDTTTGSSA